LRSRKWIESELVDEMSRDRHRDVFSCLAKVIAYGTFACAVGHDSLAAHEHVLVVEDAVHRAGERKGFKSKPTGQPWLLE
jgi:hypothetical protein